MECYENYHKVDDLDRPKVGIKITESGAAWYTPYVPDCFETGYRYRRNTQYGTQVRNSEDQEWRYFWDL